MAEEYVNDNLVLISGASTTGKSAALANLPNPEGVMYLNCEAGKKLPFPAKFKQFKILEPYQVYEAFDAVEAGPNGEPAKVPGIHTIVLDTSTFLMDMFETIHVTPAEDGRQAWGMYADYFRKLMQYYAAKSTKNVIILAHTLQVFDEKAGVLSNQVPIKGALKNNGIESFFSIVVSTKRMALSALTELNDKNERKYETPMLNITEDDELLGVKYVFQTKITRETIHERIRSPMGMFSQAETYMDNDCALLLSKLNNYYNG